MIVKIKATQIVEYYNGGYEIFPWPRHELPTGKVSISLKCGRRRRMMAGRVASTLRVLVSLCPRCGDISSIPTTRTNWRNC